MRFRMRKLFPIAVKPETVKKRKDKIPVALREQVWIHKMGRVFEGKCPTVWCENTITVFDFHSGHNIPESKGGPTTKENLIPLCSRCNLSMGSAYTFEEWCALSPPVVVVPKPRWICWK
jgi:5-methylcytosine-specific restriction endonuclease McrA